jgi:hypothetical protein
VHPLHNRGPASSHLRVPARAKSPELANILLPVVQASLEASPEASLSQEWLHIHASVRGNNVEQQGLHALRKKILRDSKKVDRDPQANLSGTVTLHVCRVSKRGTGAAHAFKF